MATNIPKTKIEIIAGVTQGTPVTDKKNGNSAKDYLEKQLNKVYTLARKAEAGLTALTMINNMGPKDKASLTKQVKAIGEKLNEVAIITNNLREGQRAVRGVETRPAAPEQPQPTGRRPGKS